MTFALFCFYLFAAVAVLAALGVVSSRNPVYAVLLLILTFFSVACTWLLADAEFLGLILAMVYVGAVMVLFLFVVMMLDIKIDAMREGFAKYLPVGIVVGVIMLVEILALIGVRAMHAAEKGPDPALVGGGSNVEWIGTTLFTRYLMPFEIAAVILTVGLVAAVTLTLRKRADHTRRQDISRQVSVDVSRRVRMVEMAADTAWLEREEVVEPAPAPPAEEVSE